MNTTTYMKIRMDIGDAQDFIKQRIESAMETNAIVTIEPKISPFALFPCLLMARNVYIGSKETKIGSPAVNAIIALRNAAKERGMDLTLADAKAVVDGFIVD